MKAAYQALEKDIPIASIDIPTESSTSYNRQKLPAAYEALRKHGFVFKTYEER